MPRTTIEKSARTALAAGSSTVGLGLEGAIFRLPSRGWLTEVSVLSGGTVVGGPLRVTVDVTLGPTIQLITKGWLRQLASPTEGAVVWHGRLPLGKDENFVRFLIQNNTENSFTWRGAWVVEHE